MSSDSRPPILIAGYYGASNAGDELILKAILDPISRAGTGAAPVVVSSDPAATEAMHGVRAIAHTDIEALVQRTRDAQAVVLGGGGLFHDHFGVETHHVLRRSNGGVSEWSTMVLLAHLLGKPLICHGQGIGPLNTDEGKLHARMAVEVASRFTVRDQPSLDLLEEIAGPHPAKVTADPVFAIDLPGHSLSSIARPNLVVTLRQWEKGVRPDWVRQVALALDAFVESEDGIVSLVPFQARHEWELTNDLDIAEAVVESMTRRDRTRLLVWNDLAQLVGYIQDADLVLGMRLHSLILAALGRAPMVAIEYDPKVRNFMETLGLQGFSVPLDEVSADSIGGSLSKALSQREQINRTLDARAGVLRKAAEEDAAGLVASLGAQPKLGEPGPATAEILRRVLLSHALRGENLHTHMEGLIEAKESADLDIRRLQEEAEVLRQRLKPLQPLLAAARKGKSLVRRDRQPAMEPPEERGDPSAPTREPTSGGPLVSVVLPVYNQADLLLDSVASVLAQTYTNIELIVVDDGSSDLHEQHLETLDKDPRVVLIRQENRGLPGALNEGFRHARGSLWSWTSADNLMHLDAIAELVAGLLAEPGAVLAYADVELVGEDSEPLDDPGDWAVKSDPSRPSLIRFFTDDIPLGYEVDNYIGSCFLYRADAARAAGEYSSEMLGLEDYDYWLRLQQLGRLKHIRNQEPLYRYRIHRGSLTHQIRGRSLFEFEQLMDELLREHRGRMESASARARIALTTALVDGDREELARLSQHLPLDVTDDSGSPGVITLGGPQAVIEVTKDRYVVRSNVSKVEVWRGVDLPPLLRKARNRRDGKWEFPQAYGRPIIGIPAHLLADKADAYEIRSTIASESSLFFAVIVDGQDAETSPLAVGLDNTATLMLDDRGESYGKLGTLSAIWAPFDTSVPEPLLLEVLALGYTIARPVLFGSPYPDLPYPYYLSGGVSIRDATAEASDMAIDDAVADGYLTRWSRAGSLDRAVGLARIALQRTSLLPERTRD